MNRQLFGDLDLGTFEPLVAGGAIVGSLPSLGWLALMFAGAAVAVGVAVVVVAASDWATAVEVTGPPIMRLCTIGGDEKPRYYVAVDDGSRRR